MTLYLPKIFKQERCYSYKGYFTFRLPNKLPTNKIIWISQLCKQAGCHKIFYIHIFHFTFLSYIAKIDNIEFAQNMY